MRLLDRYLLREFLIPLSFCLCGFLIFWIAFDLFSELHTMQEKHLLARDIAEYYVVKSPEFLILVLPVSLLLALLYALTTHARHNELTAIRASGVSLGRLCAPYLAVGLVASIGLFAVNEFLVPKTDEMADKILLRRVERQLGPKEKHVIEKLDFVNSRVGGEGRKWHIASYDTKTFEMTAPQAQWPSTNGTRLWLSADKAVWTNGMWVFSGKVRELLEANGQLRPIVVTNLLAMPEFSESPSEIQSEIAVSEQWRVASTRRADIPLYEVFNYLRLHPHPEKQLRLWLQTKMYGRLAGPWTCLVVVLLGVPFAAASGRRNVFVGVAASIFIVFSYFILQQFGFAFGSAGYVPPIIGAWLPNLIFAAIGLVMMAKVR